MSSQLKESSNQELPEFNLLGTDILPLTVPKSSVLLMYGNGIKGISVAFCETSALGNNGESFLKYGPSGKTDIDMLIPKYD